jgi:hypothetical protein
MEIKPVVREGRVMAAAFGGGLAATRAALILLPVIQLTTARRIMDRLTTAPAMRAARIMVEVLMVVDMAAVSEADTIRSHLINAHSGVWRTS